MGRLGKAFLYGVITEIVASILTITLLLVGHFGTCGPTDLSSYVGIYIQYPGFWLMEKAFWNADSQFQPIIIFMTQFLVWTFLWFAVLLTRDCIQRKGTAPRETGKT